MYGMDRALIVDDDHLITHAMSRALHPYYPEVRTVASGHEALQELSSCRYHICFLDMEVHEDGGLNLMKKMRELSPDTKMVMMTRLSLSEDMKKEMEQLCFCFLPKPFEIAELKGIATRALGRQDDVSLGSSPNMRRVKRLPLNKTVQYSITIVELGKPVNLSLKGDIIDISDMGVSLKTHYPLEAGHILSFSSDVDLLAQRAGVVKWSNVTADNDAYRVGIEFIRSGQS